ncbi:diguanylate cyclase [Paraglaciecola aquimarina]|uniref:diguanylate cyclase n=1 Tax=Paraglaciecola algarum TaxID=3050085 RepID=A0ABS9D7E1_9ALTE|nr:diguanylate cyclase [Paraglaciecola sp. G1-23]MCF2948786.1 diguanylate cyclase [Paraglaciecola sp. G1-23]
MKPLVLKALLLLGMFSLTTNAFAFDLSDTIDQRQSFPILERKLIIEHTSSLDDFDTQFSVRSNLADLYILYNRIDLLNVLISRIQSSDITSLSEKQEAQLLYFKAYSDYFSGQSNLADSRLNQALKLLKTDQKNGQVNISDNYLQTKLNLLLGLNKAYIQEYEEAISIVTSVFELASQNGWSRLKGKSLFYLGDIQYELKNYEAALEHYKRSLHFFDNSDLVDIAVSKMAIAQMTNIVGDKLEALVLLDEATADFEHQQNTSSLADAFLLKSYFIGDSRPKEALEWLTKSVKIREKLGIPIDIANAYVHFSSLLLDNGKLDEGLKYSQAATELVEPLDDYSAKWDAYATHGILLNENKDYQQAYEYMRKAERALLTKARLDITNETARLSVQFKLRQQELENIYSEREKASLEEHNLLLQSKVTLQQEIQQNQNLMLIGLLILLVLFMGLILIIYRLYYKTKILASRDGLTGLDNRRTIIAHAEHQFAVSVRYGHAISVIMLDIDRFKLINDQHGHAEGDKTLKAIAKILRNMLRESDKIGRIGGEEFLLVLPNTEREEALHFAERIRLGVKIQLLEMGHEVKDVTVSLGVASLERFTVASTNNIQQLIALADQALYLAKNRGRDQVQSIEVENTLKSAEVVQ